MKFTAILLPFLTTLALASPVEKRATVASYNTCHAEITELYPNEYSGCLQSGSVERVNGGSNTNTLIAITIRDGFAGQTCTLNFQDPYYVNGTRGIQLFTVGGPVTGGETWNERPFRNQHVGTFKASLPGTASWSDSTARSFLCPKGGTTLYFEAVPTGDNDAVFWKLPSGGLVVTVG
ncbi:hypothetical protein BZA05DRAFT_382672 [Tricharina praecox]|uniref:uncharacterized protein n=1 Tax=Tricharina praecox TaxID=43433 RepID=UPI00221EF10B|nr:uncharacterized protein BZA05DRAFT_382672 [Tricharina praecox]KAI5858875.1 hypothetical protein BZA05DRAFT_382672 [Tricharina praecox]